MGEQVINIAFVDDHNAIRAGIKEVICKSGRIKVQMEARNGQDFLLLLEKATTLPDVCLLDINMPVMNGFETQKQLIRKYPQIKTLVLTAHKGEMAIYKMINYGAKGFLSKDCDLAEVEEAIVAIHYEGIYHSDIADKAKFRAVKNKKVKVPGFTDMEMDIIRLLPTQLTYEEIARKLGTTSKSVEGHRDIIFRKLQLNTRVAVVLKTIEMGLVPLNFDY